ncbi:hypothetical protein D3C75_614810 [compost metagenome]
MALNTLPCKKAKAFLKVFGILSCAILRQSLISMLRKNAKIMAIPKLAMKVEKEPRIPAMYFRKVISHPVRTSVASLKYPLTLFVISGGKLSIFCCR